jgi:hypothetical protein
MKQKTQSSTKDKSMSSEPELWENAVNQREYYFVVVKSFRPKSRSQM